MCLIVIKETNNGTFHNKKFKAMLNRNDDGLGFMWRENGRVLTDKTVGTNQEKFQMFQKYRGKSHWVMHSRYTTHGLTDLANCHPYEVLNMDKGDPIDLYMMHNGVINNAPETNKDMSDTWHFVEHIVKPIVNANLDMLWNDEHIQDMLQHYIGLGSKLVFLRSDDIPHPVLTFNRKAGTVEDGCWLSNTYSVRPSVTTTYNSHRPYTGGNYNNNYSSGSSVMGFGKQSEKKVHDEYYSHDPADWNGYYAELASSCELPERTSAFRYDITGSITPDGKYDIHGDLLLTDQEKDDKIIHLRPNKSSLIVTPEEVRFNLASALGVMQNLSDAGMDSILLDDPDTAAAIIKTFYTNNTMDYDTIVQQIDDLEGRKSIGKLIRSLKGDYDYPITQASIR